MLQKVSIIFLTAIPVVTTLSAQIDSTQSNAPAILQPKSPDLPWLGFQIERVSDTVRAQLPKLPKGTGFVITTVDPKSPCNQAGLQAHDIVWKFNDQLLINEAQLEVLLNLQLPGNNVKLTFFRSGEEKTTDLIIGKLPAQQIAVMGPHAPGISPPVRVPEMPIIEPLDVEQLTAQLEVGSAVIQLESRDEGLWLTIDDKGVNVFEDILNETTEKTIPKRWLPPVKELRDTLQNRLEREK